MIRCIDPYPRAEQHIVADFNAAAIEHDAVEVRIEVVANRDVEAEFAAEGRLEIGPVSYRLKKLTENGFAFCLWLTEAGIVFIGEKHRLFPCLNEFRCQVVVHLSRQHGSALFFQSHDMIPFCMVVL